MKTVSIVMVLLAFAVLVGGCGDEVRQYEDYKLQSLSDLDLKVSNHPHGFERNQCFTCHNVANIHHVNRLNAPNFDLAQPLVDQSGLSSCTGCHGRNGVAP